MSDQERSMSGKAQPTIDGKSPPPLSPLKSKGGRPRLPPHLQTLQHERAREWHARRRAIGRAYDLDVDRRHRRLRKSTSPLLPFTKIEVLLEWHHTCPGSQVFPPPSQEDSPNSWDEAKDERRYPIQPPKAKERYRDE